MEIGSIFEIHTENLFTKEIEGNIIFPFMSVPNWQVEYFNTGRSAIEAFLSACCQIHKVWLPAFICTSVIDAVKRAGKEISYYPVDCLLNPDMNYLTELKLHKGDMLYVMQYFGLSIPKEFLDFIEKQRKRGILIFEDITMSLLSKNSNSIAIGDYVLGSIRKWIGIPDGAFLATKDRMPEMEKENASYDYTLYYFTAQIMKALYLSNPKKFDKEQFLSLSNAGIESLFSDYTIRHMSEISYRLLRSENWADCYAKRRNNYETLYDLLVSIPKIKLLHKCSEGMVPMGMFILVEERDALLNYLISNGIYCNVHWRQNEATDMFENTAYLSRHCITIPCDHRYSEKEMRHIYDIVKSFWED